MPQVSPGAARTVMAPVCVLRATRGTSGQSARWMGLEEEMRIYLRLVLAALVGVVVVALAGPVGVAHAHGSAPAATHVSAQDVTFLKAAHQGNLAEIAAGHVALAKSHDAEVRRIATHLIADHLKLDAGVKQVAAAHHVRLPAKPTRAQRAALAAVARKSGAAFDHAWL